MNPDSENKISVYPMLPGEESTPPGTRQGKCTVLNFDSRYELVVPTDFAGNGICYYLILRRGGEIV